MDTGIGDGSFLAAIVFAWHLAQLSIAYKASAPGQSTSLARAYRLLFSSLPLSTRSSGPRDALPALFFTHTSTNHQHSQHRIRTSLPGQTARLRPTLQKVASSTTMPDRLADHPSFQTTRDTLAKWGTYCRSQFMDWTAEAREEFEADMNRTKPWNTSL
jgi:hypothetical protein